MTDWIKDSLQAGLYKRPREDGNVWAVKARVKGGSVITVTIGKEELFSATKARKEAKKILTQLAEGINPNEIKQQQRLIKKLRNFTLQQALDEYSSHVQWKDSTRSDVYIVMNRRFSDWLRRPLASITKDDCINRFNQLILKLSFSKTYNLFTMHLNDMLRHNLINVNIH